MVVMFLWCVQEVAGLGVEDISSDPKEPSSSRSECKFTIAIIVG